MLLLLLFVSYQAGIVLFTHVHYVNGVSVAHTHPFKAHTHEHNLEEYLLLQQLGHVQMLEANSQPLLEEPPTCFVDIACPVIEEKPVKAFVRFFSLRAPPLYVF